MVYATRDVTLDVVPGEVVALIGQSGAGKSTVALAALGYTRSGMFISSGRVLLDGRDLVRLGREEKADLRGRFVAYVAQSAQAALNPALHIGTQIVESLKIHRLSTAAEAQQIVLDRLEELDLPDPARISRSYPHQLSGGQQQRAMIAMAMACNPKLLVLDEPTTALDVTTQIEVLKALKDAIRRGGAAALYVSHDLAVVAQMADRILVLHHGELVESGTTDDVIGNPQAAETKALLASAHRVMSATKSIAKPADVPLLKVGDLEASYGKPVLFQKAIAPERRVLKGVSLSLEADETLAVVGESGSGKSTLARIIAGLHRPLAGSVWLRETMLPALAKERTVDQLRRVQIVFQSPDQSINPETKVFDAIARPLALYFKLSLAEKRQRVDELLEMVDLPASMAARYPRELSGGQRQRVAIARALAAKPEVILCDEFLSSLDATVAVRILELMRSLQKLTGVSYLFISHDLATVSAIADRVAVMYAGHIVETGVTQDIFTEPAHPYTQLLLRSVPELRRGWLEETAARDRGQVSAVGEGTGARCAFVDRCGAAVSGMCDVAAPDLRVLSASHAARCHLVAPSGQPVEKGMLQ